MSQPSPTQSTEVLEEAKSNLAIHAELQQESHRLAVNALYAAREGGKVMDEAAKLVADSVLAAVIPAVRNQEHQRLKEALEAQAEKLERPNLDGEDLTSATVRAVKSQGIREAVAALDTPDPSKQVGGK